MKQRQVFDGSYLVLTFSFKLFVHDYSIKILIDCNSGKYFFYSILDLYLKHEKSSKKNSSSEE